MPGSLQTLIEQKRSFIPADTDAYRISDGDTWRGIFIDALGDRLLISTRDRTIPADLLAQLRSLQTPTYHKQLDKDNKQPPAHLCGPEAPLQYTIRENGILYRIDMAAGYSQGLFLDQRENRRRVLKRSRSGQKILNTFAYTGAFSVCAALGGAETTTLDLAQPCLEWARENFRLNGLDPTAHHYCKGDTLHWLDRFAKQERRFNGIILDPPTFSRDAKGRIWRVETGYGDLARKAAACLAPGGWLLCTTNCRKLGHEDFRAILRQALPGARLVSYPMPPEYTGEDYLKCIWAETTATPL